MESLERKIVFTIPNIEWRYEMPTGVLELKIGDVNLDIQIESGLQIGHGPMNIQIEVPIYVKR